MNDEIDILKDELSEIAKQFALLTDDQLKYPEKCLSGVSPYENRKSIDEINKSILKQKKQYHKDLLLIAYKNLKEALDIEDFALISCKKCKRLNNI
jgi:hypothetical protein